MFCQNNLNNARLAKKLSNTRCQLSLAIYSQHYILSSWRQLVRDLGRVQKAWTWCRHSGWGWVTHIWRRMNEQGWNIEKHADRHIYTLVGLGFTVRQQPVWGGMVYGRSIRPMPWTTAYLGSLSQNTNRKKHSLLYNMPSVTVLHINYCLDNLCTSWVVLFMFYWCLYL